MRRITKLPIAAAFVVAAVLIAFAGCGGSLLGGMRASSAGTKYFKSFDITPQGKIVGVDELPEPPSGSAYAKLEFTRMAAHENTPEQTFVSNAMRYVQNGRLVSHSREEVHFAGSRESYSTNRVIVAAGAKHCLDVDLKKRQIDIQEREINDFVFGSWRGPPIARLSFSETYQIVSIKLDWPMKRGGGTTSRWYGPDGEKILGEEDKFEADAPDRIDVGKYVAICKLVEVDLLPKSVQSQWSTFLRK